MIGLLALMLVLAAGAVAADTAPPSVTFNKDVLPILQNKCQVCHRPGQIAPMSFLDYQSTRPWAKAIKTATVARKMPPWLASTQYGHFLNDRSLKQSDIDTLAKWADSGAAEGNPEDAPAPVEWPREGWQTRPDLIAALPEFSVGAKETVEWMNLTLPFPSGKDTYITSIEFLSSEPSVVHHMCVSFKKHTPDVVYNQYEWEDYERDQNGVPVRNAAGGRRGLALRNAGSNVVEKAPGGYKSQSAGTIIDFCPVPGAMVLDYGAHDAARLIPAGTDMVISLHYTANGRDTLEKTKIGYTVAKETPKRKFVLLPLNGMTKDFAIPPNDGSWQAPVFETTFEQDTELVWLRPHMHVRGKDTTWTLIYPDGRKEIVLQVPRWDFNWQLAYDTSIKVPKGTRMQVVNHYDNSANNPANPNPGLTVYNGNQSWEEMFSVMTGIVVPMGADPNKVVDMKKVRVGDGE